VKGQLSKCALELLGHANVVFEPDGRGPFTLGLSADKVMGGTPSGVPARATADALPTSGDYGLPPTASIPLT